MKSLTIGILGGGQLGRMTCFEAHKMGHKTIIFTDQKFSSASFVSNQTMVYDFKNKAKLEEFANKADIITYEFENIPLEAVEFLEKRKPVFPKSSTLKITQNRLLEKSFLNACQIKTANFFEIKSKKTFFSHVQNFTKSVLKTATMGYDGKGQFVIENEDDAIKTFKEVEKNSLLKNKLILEEFCPFESEISVIVARSQDGEIICYEPLTNIHKNAILDQSIYPAKINPKVKAKAMKIGEIIAEKIDLIGILAVEFFVTQNDELLVNEMAPRPHNSGHFSMDSCKTSQFEQTIRAITNMKLGNVKFHSKGYMKNLIGEEVENIEQFENNKDAKIHLYSKSEVKLGRKMGHVNVIEGPINEN